MNNIKRIKLSTNTLTLLGMIVLVFIIMALTNPENFYSFGNVQSMILQIPEFGIMAIACGICMISGGIDLSQVGIANLAGVTAASVMVAMGDNFISIAVAILCALLAGAFAGAINGFLIGYLKLPPMVVTLSGLELFRGLALGITTGPAIIGLPEGYNQIVNGSLIPGISNVVLVFIPLIFVVSFIMNRTVFGRQIYFMGSNNEAARYSGINCARTTLKTYIMAGILGAIAGIILSSHFESARSDQGAQYTLLSVLIIVLGGVHPDGGKGKIGGIVLAVLLIQFITQMFTMLQLDTNFRTAAFGFLLIAALVITLIQDNLAAKRAYKKSLQTDS